MFRLLRTGRDAHLRSAATQSSRDRSKLVRDVGQAVNRGDSLGSDSGAALLSIPASPGAARRGSESRIHLVRKRVLFGHIPRRVAMLHFAELFIHLPERL